MRKFAIMVLVAFGLVSVSMGAYIPKDYEENYQKLKAEMEEVVSSEYWDRVEVTCSWDKDGKVVVGGRLSRSNKGLAEDWCHLKNVLAFFDEIRAMEVKVDKKKGEREFYVAINKVKEMPRFKEDYGIGITKMSINESRFTSNAFWKIMFEKWKMTKLSIEAEEPRINKTYFR